MYIPPRKKRGADKTCTRIPRLLSAVTVGAVALGATLGLTPSATADPATQLVVDIVGDSYMAGDGMADTYLNPTDQRHRSLVSPALQALSRVASENPGLEVDANVVASSGAVTANYFTPQQGLDGQGRDVVVNTPQHRQIRPNAQIVIVGFGGSDAELAEVLAIVKPSNGSTPGDVATKVKNFSGLLDTTATDQSYVDQALAAPLGGAPTLVARLLQVLGGVAERAPNARIIVTNYPLPVDPENAASVALIKKRDLVTVQKFLLDLNETIERAVRICACANLVDLTSALDGHEAYTSDSAYDEPAAGQPHPKALGPNDEGAALMAGPLATDLASLLGIRTPKANDGKVTVPKNIAARSGESDIDGDLVPDFQDEAPEDAGNHRQKHDRPAGQHRDRSPDRSHPPKSTKHTRLPDVLGGLGLGHKNKDRRPEGHIPVQILPPLAPPTKREPDGLPEDKTAAEPNMAERKPARTDDSRRVHGTDHRRSIVDRDIPAEPDAESGFRRIVEPEVERPVWPKTPIDLEEVVPEEELSHWAETPAESDEAPVDQAPEEQLHHWVQKPAAEAPAEQEGWARTPADTEAPADEAPQPEQRSWAETPAEPAAEAPTHDASEGQQQGWARTPAAEAPAAEAPPAEAPQPEQRSWAETPAEPASAEAVPEQPVDEAANGEPVCILIYPAPAGCGTPSQPDESTS